MIATILENLACAALRPALRIMGRFRGDRKGATAVEFGIICVPFFGLLMVIFESTFMLFNAEIVDAVAANVSRQLMTGQIQTNGKTCSQQKQDFQNMVCPASGPRPGTGLPSNFDCAKVIIDVRQSNAVNNLDVSNSLYSDPSQAQFAPAPAGQNNIIRIIYPLPALLPVFMGGPKTSSMSVIHGAGDAQISGSWKHILMGIAVFRTEPFGGGGGSSC